MNILVEKMGKLGLLRFEIIFYAIIMTGLALAMPVTMLVVDVTSLANPTVLGLSLIFMLIFGLAEYFVCIRPYVLYRKLPQVQAETDGEFLYIHGKKEAKIPLANLLDANVYAHVPYICQPGFLREFIVHIFSYKYGDVILEVPDYGEFKMRFVANAEDVAYGLSAFILQTTNKDKAFF
jgi:hypothetical protein